ncbi:MAG TPA: hypothetical protein VEK11_01890 [Thermoanaerobaculia bacterium]|nr:hypothetical protein [Thermoanaerobaculia bacterium]
MTEHHFETEITGKLEIDPEALRERVYRTATGMVRVSVQWPRVTDSPSLRVGIDVIDAREGGDPRDVPAFVELFFHDAFLILNIASPGSFGGVIATAGGEYRVRELSLDSHVFDVAEGRVPLADVVRWYDGLQVHARQVAETPLTKALFHLLHLARTPASDWLTVLHLAHAADALNVRSEELYELLETICGGAAPVLHPMHDEALDERVDEGELAMADAIDAAAKEIVKALQVHCAPHA